MTADSACGIAWLRHLVADDPAALHRWLDAQPPTLGQAYWLRDQLLAPYAHFRLRQAEALRRLPPEVAHFLNESARRMALREAVSADACHRVLRALAEADVEVVALKGWALAHTAYPAPRCRPMGDLDLWVQRDQRVQAIAALTAIGYHAAAMKDDRPSALAWAVEGECQLRGPAPADLLVELQWPAFRSEWVRRAARIEHDQLWREATVSTIGGQPVRLMSPEASILLLAFHQGINHHFTFPCWLRTQVDLHHLALVEGLRWEEVVARARRWGIATVTWLSLSLAARLLGSPIPAEVLDALAPPAARQRLLARFDIERSVVEMRPTSYDRRRLLLQLALTDSAAAMGRLVYRAFLPEDEWLMLRYELAARRELPRARLRHLSSLLVRGRV